MSQQSVLRQWTEEIRKNMPHLSKPQSKALGSLLEDKPVVLLVDETGLKDRLKAMVVAVAFEGRSIPDAWRRAPRCSGWALTCSTSAWSGGEASSVRCCSQAV